MKNTSFLKLQGYLNREESKVLSKQAIKGLLRSMLEPVVEDNSDALVLMRLFDTESLTGLIKRVEFANAKVYAFNDFLDKIQNISKSDVFESLEFVLVLSNRYLSVLIWDYSLNGVENMADAYFLVNSKEVTDVYKLLMENSTKNFDEFISRFGSERRENRMMNNAVNKIVEFMQDIEQELTVKEVQSKDLNYVLEFDTKTKILAHELRNHMSIIDLHSAIVKKRIEDFDDTPAKSSIEQAVQNIKLSLTSMNSFLNNLKEFNDVVISKEEILPCINAVISLAKPRADAKNIEFLVKNECSSKILVDTKKFENVLLNLFYNAIDAIGEENGGKIKVTVFSKEEGFVKILVEDTGKGISKEALNEIFKYGFTTKTTGSGLGLHIAKISMLAQEGNLRLLDTDEDGTIFELRVKAI